MSLLRTVSLAACFTLLLTPALPLPARAGDLILSLHPASRGEGKMVEVRTVQATLLGYDPNFDGDVISPYIIVRFVGDKNVSTVYLTVDVRIDGRPFTCDGSVNVIVAGSRDCARLPQDVALSLPARITVAVWSTSGSASIPAPILVTDSIDRTKPAS